MPAPSVDDLQSVILRLLHWYPAVVLPNLPSVSPVDVPQFLNCPFCDVCLESDGWGETQGICLERGLHAVRWRRRRCIICSRVFSNCWHFANARTSDASLSGKPSGEYFQIIPVPRAASVAFVSHRLLDWLTVALSHAQMSARGLTASFEDMFGTILPEHIHQSIFSAWITRQTIFLLWDSYDAEISSLTWKFERHDFGAFRHTLQQCEPLLREHLLHRFMRDHDCNLCSAGTIGVDGAAKVAPRTCHADSGFEVYFPASQTVMEYPCRNLPESCFRFCCEHLPPGGAPQPVCPDGHSFDSAARDLDWWRSCDLCAATIPAGSRFYQCVEKCDYEICPACWPRTRRAAAPGVPIAAATTYQRFSASRVQATQVNAAPAWNIASHYGHDVNPCQIDKESVKYRRRGRLGGVLVLLRACGSAVDLNRDLD